MPFSEVLVDVIAEVIAEEIKGGSGSGNFGHSGRPGKVGGSGGGSGNWEGPGQPRYAHDNNPKRNSPQNRAEKPKEGETAVATGPKPLQHHSEIKEGPMGRGWFITKKGDLYDVTSDFGAGTNDHVGVFLLPVVGEKLGLSPKKVGKLAELRKRLDEMAPDDKRWDKLSDKYQWMASDLMNEVLSKGVIRVRAFKSSISIEGENMPLKRVQQLMKAGKIPSDKKSKFYVDGTDDPNRRYMENLTSSAIQGSMSWKMALENSKAATGLSRFFNTIIKGGSGSGNFGHSGRPGKVGGSGGESVSKSPAMSNLREFSKWEEENPVIAAAAEKAMGQKDPGSRMMYSAYDDYKSERRFVMDGNTMKGAASFKVSGSVLTINFLGSEKGSGAGTKILKDIISEGRVLGASKVVVEARVDSRSYFEKRGFSARKGTANVYELELGKKSDSKESINKKADRFPQPYHSKLSPGHSRTLRGHFIKATQYEKDYLKATEAYEKEFQKTLIEYFKDQEKKALSVIKSFSDTETKGGSGSGNYGHSGRPGKVGGSGGGSVFADPHTVEDLVSLSDISLPADNSKYSHFYHAVRFPQELEDIVDKGIMPGTSGKVFLSKDEVRDRGGGFVMIRLPRSFKTEEGLDRVEPGLSYRQWTSKEPIPSKYVFRAVREVPIRDSEHTVREDVLAKYAASHQGLKNKDVEALPPKYQSWFSLGSGSGSGGGTTGAASGKIEKAPAPTVCLYRGSARMVAFFKDQEKEALAVVKSISDIETKAPPNALPDRFDFDGWTYEDSEWNKRLAKEGGLFIKDVYDREGNRVWQGLKRRVGNAIEGSFDLDNPLWYEFIEDYPFEFASQVNEQTVTMLRAALSAGFEAGASMPRMAEIVREVFDVCTRYRSLLIARTETIRASNGAADMAYELSGVVEGKEWLTTDDDRLCPHCLEMNGKIVDVGGSFFDKGDKFTVGGNTMVLDYETVKHPPLHPNCLIDHQTPVYTSDGWKPIVKIKVGDLVLSHKGKFRKVTELHRSVGRVGTGVSTIWMSPSHKVSLTSNHPIILNGKWREAKEAKTGDVVLVMASSCAYCGEGIPYYRAYCNESCRSKHITQKQWADHKHRENISKKTSAQLKREYEDGTRDPIAVVQRAHAVTRAMCAAGKCPLSRPDVREIIRTVTNTPEQRKASSARMKAGNPSCIQEVRERMTQSYKKTLLENPDKHPNRIMARNGFISSLEKRVMCSLDRLGIAYEHQHPIGRFFADFALPKYGLVIEVDGEYWHSKNPEKDLARQKEIESLGWKVVRFPEKMIKSKLDKVSVELARLTANHDDLYNFVEVKIHQVEHWGINYRAKRLYNLSIEEDESYLAKGLVVHNCRCTLVPVVKEEYKSIIKGGSGSGNFGHAGRPGKVGGSSDSNIDAKDKLFNNALKYASAQYRGLTPKEITNGHCFEWARYVKSKYNKVTVKDIDLWSHRGKENLPYHVWVEYKGRAYDAEHLNGVNSWKELNYFKEHTNQNIIPKLRVRVVPSLNGISNIVTKGGPGSGNFGHAGIPGHLGGSGKRGGSADRGFAVAKDRESFPDHIKALKVPPAWKNVKYNPDPKGDLLVTGIDAKGRKQYIYSEKYTAQKAEKKFARVNELMKKYNDIVLRNEKNRVSKDKRTRECADCLSLVMNTGLRPGGDKDTKAKVQAYGATTMLGEHVRVSGGKVSLSFTGKKGVPINLPIENQSVAKMLSERKSKAGDKGKLFRIDPDDLLPYTKSLTAGKFKTKDFRTAIANDIARTEIGKIKAVPKNEKEYKKMVRAVAVSVSSKLGNTPTVALQSYIHPSVFAGWRASL